MAFYNPYQQYNPYGYAPVSPQNGAGSVFPQQSQIIRVNGKNGAEAFRMDPNSSILLMDDLMIGNKRVYDRVMDKLRRV